MSRSLRRVLAVALVASVAMSGIAIAGSTSVVSRLLTATAAAVTPCGSLAATTPAYQVTAGTITALTLSGIPASCVGGQLTVSLTQSATDVAHAGPLAITGTTFTITTLSAAPTATVPTQVRMSVVGP